MITLNNVGIIIFCIYAVKFSIDLIGAIKERRKKLFWVLQELEQIRMLIESKDYFNEGEKAILLMNLDWIAKQATSNLKEQLSLIVSEMQKVKSNIPK